MWVVVRATLGIASEDNATVAEKIAGASVKGKNLAWRGTGGQLAW